MENEFGDLNRERANIFAKLAGNSVSASEALRTLNKINAAQVGIVEKSVDKAKEGEHEGR